MNNLTKKDLIGKFIKTGNKYLNLAVQQKLFDLGFDWHGDFLDYDFNCDYIGIDQENKFGVCSGDFLEDENYEEITLDQLLNISEEYNFKVGKWYTNVEEGFTFEVKKIETVCWGLNNITHVHTDICRFEVNSYYAYKCREATEEEIKKAIKPNIIINGQQIYFYAEYIEFSVTRSRIDKKLLYDIMEIHNNYNKGKYEFSNISIKSVQLNIYGFLIENIKQIIDYYDKIEN